MAFSWLKAEHLDSYNKGYAAGKFDLQIQLDDRDDYWIAKMNTAVTAARSKALSEGFAAGVASRVGKFYQFAVDKLSQDYANGVSTGAAIKSDPVSAQAQCQAGVDMLGGMIDEVYRV